MKNLSVWEWVGLSFAMALVALIPFVGLFGTLGLWIWFAFGKKFENHVLRNYSRAQLIFIAFGLLALSVLVGFGALDSQVLLGLNA